MDILNVVVSVGAVLFAAQRVMLLFLLTLRQFVSLPKPNAHVLLITDINLDVDVVQMVHITLWIQPRVVGHKIFEGLRVYITIIILWLLLEIILDVFVNVNGLQVDYAEDGEHHDTEGHPLVDQVLVVVLHALARTNVCLVLEDVVQAVAAAVYWLAVLGHKIFVIDSIN